MFCEHLPREDLAFFVFGVLQPFRSDSYERMKKIKEGEKKIGEKDKKVKTLKVSRRMYFIF